MSSKQKKAQKVPAVVVSKDTDYPICYPRYSDTKVRCVHCHWKERCKIFVNRSNKYKERDVSEEPNVTPFSIKCKGCEREWEIADVDEDWLAFTYEDRLGDELEADEAIEDLKAGMVGVVITCCPKC